MLESSIGNCSSYNFIQDKIHPTAYGKSGLQITPTEVIGAVTPKTIEEVSLVVQESHEKKIPIYPISTGKNWGYGAGSPVQDGCIVLDLSKLNSISEFDEEIGVVKITPGVTQGDLYDFLADTPYMMDVTGAGPDTSILGNILERGFGHTSMGYRSQHFLIADGVMADGRIVTLTNSSGKMGRHGSAAGLHELMLQSNLLIVTSMYLQLRLRPESSLRCVVKLFDETKLSPYIKIIQQLKQEGVFEGLPHIGNNLRTKSIFGNTQTPETKVYGWTLVTGIYGSRNVAKAKAKRAKHLLKSIGKVIIITEKQLLMVKKLLNYTSRWKRIGNIDVKAIAERFDSYHELLTLIDGFPSDLALRGCYWKSKKHYIKHADPIQDDCGFRWVAPVLPMKGEEVTRFLNIAKKLYREAGFEMAVTLTVITPHMCQAILSIYFDTQDQAEWKNANKLAKTLKNTFIKNGWSPYRVATDEMDDIKHYTDPSVMEIRSLIKKSLDPENIIAPGRYAW